MEKIGGMTLKRPITDEVKKTVLEDLAPEIHEIKDPKLKQLVVDVGPSRAARRASSGSPTFPAGADLMTST